MCDEEEDILSEDDDEEEGILKPLFRFVLSVAIRRGAYAAYLLMGYALIILATTGLWVSSSAAGRQGPEDSALELAARDACDAKLSFRAKGGRGYDKYGDFYQ
ncbi:putative transmembrane protein [Toxoplasma gondii GT1]|uniref:Putative transmembrane protein n=1 Tax=Toxoplasma gondii (strain ATCC 50853 / GT1) TaxID=507601 RepID=S7W0J0_TOXGG|nr:putative transmembrane protein [Toxoplasma gondii GT1]